MHNKTLEYNTKVKCGCAISLTFNRKKNKPTRTPFCTDNVRMADLIDKLA